MIKGFKHKGLKRYWEKNDKRGIQNKHLTKIKLILDVLDTAFVVDDINFPGSNLHILEPKQNNIWAVDVSGNWRITFKFENNNVYIVDYLDYH
ncbi:MAG: Killer protein [Lentisphaerae bacterium]|nr:Killer protein [Lentisphaerota bacterium]